MRYLKKVDEDKLHIWTEELAKRDDMVEGFMPDALTLTKAEKKVEDVLPETSPVEKAAYSLKSAGFGRWYVLDANGETITEAPFASKVEAEARLAELSA